MTRHSDEQPFRLDADLFAALGHPTRCTIVEFLAKQTARPTEIAKCLENTFGLWHHLNRLVAMGLVETRRLDHTHSVYSINTEVLTQAARCLMQLAEQAQAATERPIEDTTTEELEQVLAP